MTESMATSERTGARAEILQSIRSRLAESAPVAETPSNVAPFDVDFATTPVIADKRSLVETFKHRLESVGGRCVAVDSEAQVFSALKAVLAELKHKGSATRRIALTDAAILGSMAQDFAAAECYEVAVLPLTNDLFQFDVGITTAQAAIAETGTLVLEQALERHRLVSLLPPVHIAIVNAKDVCETLGEAILHARVSCETSAAVTFITGPSRTADIELTLTIGVHGPKELYVIVYEDGRGT